MKIVKINQIHLGELVAEEGGWKYHSKHPATDNQDGTIYKSLEEAQNLLDDDCVSPCIDLVLSLMGRSDVCRYKLEII